MHWSMRICVILHCNLVSKVLSLFYQFVAKRAVVLALSQVKEAPNIPEILERRTVWKVWKNSPKYWQQTEATKDKKTISVNFWTVWLEIISNNCVCNRGEMLEKEKKSYNILNSNVIRNLKQHLQIICIHQWLVELHNYWKKKKCHDRGR